MGDIQNINTMLKIAQSMDDEYIHSTSKIMISASYDIIKLFDDSAHIKILKHDEKQKLLKHIKNISDLINSLITISSFIIKYRKSSDKKSREFILANKFKYPLKNLVIKRNLLENINNRLSVIIFSLYD